MLVTEAEAKENWCPESRIASGRRLDSGLIVASPDSPVCNRIDVGADTTALFGKCGASNCMAWRWYDTKFEVTQVAYDTTQMELKEPPSPGEGWVSARDCSFENYKIGGHRKMGREFQRPRQDRRGYCGLAGGIREPE